MKKYYTYAYLREDGTPYYIGKGSGNRIHRQHSVNIPPEDRRVFLKQNLTEEEAFSHEVEMIEYYGRKCMGGLLENRAPGGKQPPKHTEHTEETKQKISATMKGRFPSAAHTPEIYQQRSISYKLRGVQPPSQTATFQFISPQGVIHTGKNINEFAKQHNLSPSSLYDMRRGRQQQHRGWTLCQHTQ